MLLVQGSADTSESRAGQRLRELMTVWLPGLDTTSSHRAWIVPSAQCFGSKTQDVDLLLITAFGDKAPSVRNRQGQLIRPRNLCLMIEVKTHDATGIRMNGTHVEVDYRNKWKDVTMKLEDQCVSVRKFLRRRTGQEAPLVAGLIWLRGISRAGIAGLPENVVTGDASFEDFILAAEKSRLAKSRVASDTWEITSGESEQVSRAANVFTAVQQPTRLDRRRIELITRRWLDTQQYADQIGDKLLIFRGRGGTGKTVALLRIAHDLHRDRGARVLVLTYNRALVVDIQRLFTLTGISSSDQSAIQVRTVHSFLPALAKHLTGWTPAAGNERAAFEGAKAALLDTLPLTEDDRRACLTTDAFDWDYVFVDEGQDWPAVERDVLFGVYGYRRFVVADGFDQLTRARSACDWRYGLDKDASRIISLRKVRRLKAALCEFLQVFADLLGIHGLGVEPDYEAPGGRVIIVEGDYFGSRALHDRLMLENAEAGNKPVDVLVALSTFVRDMESPGQKHVAEILQSWGYECWNGLDRVARQKPPSSSDEIRIVQYPSCRGLEGWMAVNLGFDRYFEYKRDTYRTADQLLTPTEHAAAAHEFAAKWMLIPCTRAVDTLVLEISDRGSEIGRLLQRAASECGDSVTWIPSQKLP